MLFFELSAGDRAAADICGSSVGTPSRFLDEAFVGLGIGGEASAMGVTRDREGALDPAEFAASSAARLTSGAGSLPFRSANRTREPPLAQSRGERGGHRLYGDADVLCPRVFCVTEGE